MQNNISNFINKNVNAILLTLILILGTFLRCYHLFSIPMTHDELSALSRLNFSSFNELIEKGVKLDGHPAGIQVFLYYWTNIVGANDVVVKLPFLFMGIASIFVAYLISKKWFSIPTALIVSAYIATLQFPIMYSQLCRPYISGMFFSLLSIYFWTNYFFESNRNKNLNLIGFVIASSLCTYNHHFSALFAFIIYITGFFFLNKKNIGLYLLSGLLIALLYLPHLEIFLYQLNLGGLDWLGVPRDSFILDHIKYIFHFSGIVYITTALFVLIGITHFIVNKIKPNKFQLISIFWFFCSLLIGFYYSKNVKPVLQHSVLLFTFPFLLIFIFSFFRINNSLLKLLIISIVLIVNIYSLVYSRKHYEIFYKQPFNMFSELTHEFLIKHKSEDVTILLSENPIYLNHYFEKENTSVNYTSTPDLSLDSLRNIASKANTNYLICGNLPAEYVLALQEYYPYLVFKDYGFTYEYYIFSKDSSNHISDDLFSHNQTFENEVNKVYKMDSTMEWGPSYEIGLKDISQSRHNFIDISIDYLGNEIEQGQIAFELRNKDSLVLWRGIPVHNYYTKLKEGKWQTAYFSLRLTAYFKHKEEMDECTLKLFYWNINKKNVVIDNFDLKVRKGNEKIYALVEDFEE